MNKITKISIVLGVILLICFVFSHELQAQCPMCRMSAESNLKNGGTDGRGLNTGILYMLAMPYTLVALIGFWWWRNRKQNDKKSLDTGKEDLSRFN
jgi:hypothetical protein